MDSVLHPLTLWAQRKDRVFVTIALDDCQNPDIQLTETKLTFSSKGGHDQKLYQVELEFCHEVDPTESKQLVTAREITFNIKKKEEGPFWPRLLKVTKKNLKVKLFKVPVDVAIVDFANLKPHYIKTDFNKWRDEDDSDVEDKFTEDANFEDMVNSMGSSGLGEKFDPGEADSDDSDDEELPDLED